MLLESALAVLVLAAAASPRAVAAGAVAAAALVVPAVVRWERRPLVVLVVRVLGFRARRRRAGRAGSGRAAAAAAAPALGLPVACSAFRTHGFNGGGRPGIGLIGDGTFLTAVVRVEPDRGTRALRAERAAQPLPLAPLYEALDAGGVRLESVQLVQCTRPAGVRGGGRPSPADANYGPLSAVSGTPAVRMTWVAVRFDPELSPEAVVARGGGLLGAQRCVVRAAEQLAGRLAGAGFGAVVLGEPELVAALAASACEVVGGAAGSAPHEGVESARSWRTGERWHATYRVACRPGFAGGVGSLVEAVALPAAAPAVAVNFSLTVSAAGRREAALEAHVRITACGTEELAAGTAGLERTARRLGVRMTRMDFEQLPGVLASLPLGGTG